MFAPHARISARFQIIGIGKFPKNSGTESPRMNNLRIDAKCQHVRAAACECICAIKSSLRQISAAAPGNQTNSLHARLRPSNLWKSLVHWRVRISRYLTQSRCDRSLRKILMHGRSLLVQIRFSQKKYGRRHCENVKSYFLNGFRKSQGNSNRINLKI